MVFYRNKYHLGFIKYKEVPSGSLKYRNCPPSSSRSVVLIDNLSNKDFASSKTSAVNPLDAFPELPVRLTSLVGCNPVTTPGEVSCA